MGYTTPEAKLSHEVIKYLKECRDKKGYPLIFGHRSGKTDVLGEPDIWFAVNGVHVECELKAADGKLSGAQEKFRWRCTEQFKCLHMVPRTLEEVIEVVEALRQ